MFENALQTFDITKHKTFTHEKFEVCKMYLLKQSTVVIDRCSVFRR